MMRTGTIVAIVPCIRKKRGGGFLMKIEFLTSLFLIATSLSSRMAIQRIEQALVATVAEHGAIGISARRNQLARRR